MLTNRQKIPHPTIREIGFVENDVMPSIAKASIFFSVYFECPASRLRMKSSMFSSSPNMSFFLRR